jgi:hypothetical protein
VAASTRRSSVTPRASPAMWGTRPRRSSRARRWPRSCCARPDRPVKRRSVGPANGIVVLGYRLVAGLYDHLVGPLARIAVFARVTLLPTEGNVFVPPAAGPARRRPSPELPTSTTKPRSQTSRPGDRVQRGCVASSLGGRRRSCGGIDTGFNESPLPTLHRGEP